MIAILHSLGMFVADLFKSRCRLEAENLFLSHQLSVALTRAPPRLDNLKHNTAGLACVPGSAAWSLFSGRTHYTPTRAREGVTRKQHLLNRDDSIPSANVGGAHGAVSSDIRHAV